MEENSIKIDNTEIDYVSFGKGKTPLILIPGLSLRDVKGSGLPLAYMYRIFAKEYRVYCIDRKRIVPKNYTVEEIAKDIAFVMQMLHLENACVLGISQGGMIGQYLAINYPALVRKLVIGVSLSRNNDTVVQCVKKWVQMAEANEFEKLSIDILVKMYSDAYIKKYQWLFPILSKMSKPKDPERFVSLAKSALTCDTYERLREIKCPVYVIGGVQDEVVTGAASKEIAAKLECPLYMYEDLGHAAYDEAKDFNKRVFDFFCKSDKLSS